MDLLDRLNERIDIADDGCWNWTAAKVGGKYGGYGQLRHDGRTQYSHRLMWEAVVGPIPDGLQLDHLCRNHSCCNPDHLEPVTQRENTLRGVAGEWRKTWAAERTHCKHGHEFTEDNSYVRPDGARACRICLREAQARWLAKKEAALA